MSIFADPPIVHEVRRLDPPRAAGTTLVTPIPLKSRRTFINEWTRLKSGDRVDLELEGRVTYAGEVETISQDATIIWVCFSGAFGRRMVHRCDDEQVWRYE